MFDEFNSCNTAIEGISGPPCASGIGTVRIKVMLTRPCTVEIHNVLYVPSIFTNLISTSRLREASISPHAVG